MLFDLSPRAPHHVAHRQALEEGLRRHNALGLDAVACWGWRAGKRHRQKGRQVLVLERGYIGDRFYWTSIGLNGLNGRAEFPEYPDDGGARFAKMGVPLLPWNPVGSYVLLVGQVRGDAALQGRDLRPWYAETAKRASALYGLPVRFRPHPNELRRGIRTAVPGTETDTGPLAEAIAGAAVVVTWNSNTGVESMLAGKPTVAMDQGAMAWPVAAHELGGQANPDRQAWANALAWKQWSLDEIRSGDALVGIVEKLRG